MNLLWSGQGKESRYSEPASSPGTSTPGKTIPNPHEARKVRIYHFLTWVVSLHDQHQTPSKLYHPPLKQGWYPDKHSQKTTLSVAKLCWVYDSSPSQKKAPRIEEIYCVEKTLVGTKASLARWLHTSPPDIGSRVSLRPRAFLMECVSMKPGFPQPMAHQHSDCDPRTVAPLKLKYVIQRHWTNTTGCDEDEQLDRMPWKWHVVASGFVLVHWWFQFPYLVLLVAGKNTKIFPNLVILGPVKSWIIVRVKVGEIGKYKLKSKIHCINSSVRHHRNIEGLPEIPNIIGTRGCCQSCQYRVWCSSNILGENHNPILIQNWHGDPSAQLWCPPRNTKALMRSHEYVASPAQPKRPGQGDRLEKQRGV